MKYFYRKLKPVPGILLTLTAMVTSPVRAELAEWAIDPEHFSIGFEAGHIGYQKQLGLFLEGAGSFLYDPESNEFGSGRVEIQAGSVFTNHDDRDDHLKGRDFLNVRRNPLIVFEASGFTTMDNGATGQLSGMLTMLGESHPVTLDVTINKRARYPFGHRRETMGISAHTTINRSVWGMDYGVGNNMVGDEVTLRFELEALQQ